MVFFSRLMAGWLEAINKSAQVFTGLGVFLRLKLTVYNPLNVCGYSCKQSVNSLTLPAFS
mgnify:CR=1 FL=1